MHRPEERVDELEIGVDRSHENVCVGCEDALPVEQKDALFDEWLTSLATNSWSTSPIGSPSRVSGSLAGRELK